MTLEELQAEFPHGSRWRSGRSTRVVVGWEAASIGGDRVIWRDEETFEVREAAVGGGTINSWKRIPDPAPCPITKPTTLTVFPGGYIGIKGMATDNVGEMGLVLHPAEPGATEGRYTWKQPT